MIVRVEALNYLCLHYIRQPLAPFQVLIGPNASGKSTFLDVLAFLADVVREKGGCSHALVIFDREGCGREQVEAEALAEEVRARLAANGWPDRAEAVVLDPELEGGKAIHRRSRDYASTNQKLS